MLLLGMTSKYMYMILWAQRMMSYILCDGPVAILSVFVNHVMNDDAAKASCAASENWDRHLDTEEETHPSLLCTPFPEVSVEAET